MKKIDNCNIILHYKLLMQIRRHFGLRIISKISKKSHHPLIYNALELAKCMRNGNARRMEFEAICYVVT